MFNQKGYIVLPLILFALITAFFVIPRKSPVTKNALNKVTSNACQPDKDPNAPTATTRGYTIDNENDDSTFRFTGDVTYRRVKKNVPIDQDSFEKPGNTEVHWIKGQDVSASDGKTYRVYYPGRYAQDCGGENNKGPDGKCLPGKLLAEGDIGYSFLGANGYTWLHFYKYGIIVLVHLNDDGSVEKEDGFNNKDARTFWIADIYVDPSKDPLPEDVIKCQDIPKAPDESGIRLKTSKYSSQQSGNSNDFSTIVYPTQSESTDSKQLQLEWFKFGNSNVVYQPWWTPHCKPAIYLYPKNKSLVNVKVYPRGNFTLTDPKYDLDKGWNVWAQPNGEIYDLRLTRPSFGSRNYEYLYYEAQINDNDIDKPEDGYVVKKDEVHQLLSDLMPKLGLNFVETRQFKEYWERVLPDSPYYFIGVVDKSNLDYIEALKINPEPDSIIRVSLYFEPLDSFKEVSEPNIVTPKREGFSVVEWGGLIKLHGDTPFTCSQ
ncbi:MAG: hypothetical protein ACD_31C00002G0003 [uncultured bacterium]|uniref:Uncharacterized protein n=4 Tax=Candidatus Daviesiibacteriota TaxID=1752718 RepID=A0A0G0I098_9BACT|nr:MAG: hypothetical protein ACD_31C00002G0003 [uncultured bacterium]KKQ09546.1 MAG: hypothetical protein US19_C0013G0020 [Candidatus Daviesbacteria bacterium GW2011_GWB1_36_5]KKQ15629.1 MAG: hypothetical protein US28_C0013G0008 [Candidatus Daviesbacteria bacterium GW2011_GWA1_36_8]OGE17509.1 MAG: hypothetical protein A2858_01225 [Candidatus Daviesbacteria bacterium RIFCSPHIGHO2_01_FULL_36_37]OGE36604.1 MAG: hypothetical protein A3E66_03070 [Candidatus Daviesbacteria bacterium RIFCSPHIGHO2_12_F